MTGMHDELIQVMQSTGCEVIMILIHVLHVIHLVHVFFKDPVLAEHILQENAYDSQLAILELLQLMDLSESRSKRFTRPVVMTTILQASL